jgi:glyoxylase-like metal-dependent hydrolase (beta-lactamase superfamily II)
MIKSTPFEDVLQLTLCKYTEMIPGMFVSAFLVDGLLIDSGPAHTAEELTDFLEDKELKAVVNTHHHEDHIAANKLLQDRFGVDIYAHPLAVGKINQPARLYPYQEEVWGYPIPSKVKPLGGHISTDHYNFEVIPTPGHDRDHICLFDPENHRLFSGDLFLGTKPTQCRPMEDYWQIIDDLKYVRDLRPRVIFSALGTILTDPQKKLDTVIAALEGLGGKIWQYYDQGMTDQQIMAEIFGRESPLAERTQFQFSSLNLVRSFLNRFN